MRAVNILQRFRGWLYRAGAFFPFLEERQRSPRVCFDTAAAVVVLLLLLSGSVCGSWCRWHDESLWMPGSSAEEQHFLQNFEGEAGPETWEI